MIVLDYDETGAQTEEHQVRMMSEVAKLTAGSNGALDEAAYQRTVDTLLAGGSDPVITAGARGRLHPRDHRPGAELTEPQAEPGRAPFRRPRPPGRRPGQFVPASEPRGRGSPGPARIWGRTDGRRDGRSGAAYCGSADSLVWSVAMKVLVTGGAGYIGSHTLGGAAGTGTRGARPGQFPERLAGGAGPGAGTRPGAARHPGGRRPRRRPARAGAGRLRRRRR